jgi:hypothetical protein
MTTVSPTTYRFAFSDATADISQVIAGSYMPAGPIADVTFGGAAERGPGHDTDHAAPCDSLTHHLGSSAWVSKSAGQFTLFERAPFRCREWTAIGPL